MAQRLGICRVVLARELSLDDLRRIRPQTELELEVFVTARLCMSYSGQCNASFGMGGRSANRGQCAQQCRLPYDLVCDDEVRDLKDRKYLLSPSDLSALDLVPELIAAGVNSLKIEGRMKSPQYVASATRQYRLAIDEGAGRPPRQSAAGAVAGIGKPLLARPLARLARRAEPADRRRPQLGQPRHLHRQGHGRPRRSRGGRAYRAAAARRRRRLSFDPGRRPRPGRPRLRNLRPAGNRSKRLPAAGSNWPSAAMPSISTACSPARSFGRPTIRRSTAACARRLPTAGPAPRAAGSDGGSRRRPQAARCRPGRHGHDVPRRVGAGT